MSAFDNACDNVYNAIIIRVGLRWCRLQGNGTKDSPLKEEELRTDEMANNWDLGDEEKVEEDEEQRADCNYADTEKHRVR